MKVNLLNIPDQNERMRSELNNDKYALYSRKLVHNCVSVMTIEVINRMYVILNFFET